MRIFHNIIFVFVPLILTLGPLSVGRVAEAAIPIEELKAGVVQITTTVGGRRIGTGVIVRLDRDAAYIVTASHVIEGDSHPDVAFYSKPTRAFSSRVVGLEGGDPQGLAVLLVEGEMLEGLRALSLEQNVQVSEGEAVTIIGFPRLARTPWMVTTATIGGRAGSTLTFSGSVDEGNSGGPLLLDGKVVGVITETAGQFGYAVLSAIVRLTLEGWEVTIPQTDIAEGVKKLKAPNSHKGNLEVVDRRAWEFVRETMMAEVRRQTQFSEFAIVPLAQVNHRSKHAVLLWPAWGPTGIFIDNDVIGVTFEEQRRKARGGYELLDANWGVSGTDPLEKQLGTADYVIRGRNAGAKLSELGPEVIRRAAAFAVAKNAGETEVAVSHATAVSRLFSFKLAALSHTVTSFLIKAADLWGPSGLEYVETVTEGDTARIVLRYRTGGGTRDMSFTARQHDVGKDLWIIESTTYR